MVIITLPARLVSTAKLDYSANNNTFRAERVLIKKVGRGPQARQDTFTISLAHSG